MKLCLGTTVKLICLCARKGISNVHVGNKLFPDYESYSKKQTIIDDSLVGKWKACTNELSQEYCNAILDTDVEMLVYNFRWQKKKIKEVLKKHFPNTQL